MAEGISNWADLYVRDGYKGMALFTPSAQRNRVTIAFGPVIATGPSLLFGTVRAMSILDDLMTLTLDLDWGGRVELSFHAEDTGGAVLWKES